MVLLSARQPAHLPLVLKASACTHALVQDGNSGRRRHGTWGGERGHSGYFVREPSALPFRASPAPTPRRLPTAGLPRKDWDQTCLQAGPPQRRPRRRGLALSPRRAPRERRDRTERRLSRLPGDKAAPDPPPPPLPPARRSPKCAAAPEAAAGTNGRLAQPPARPSRARPRDPGARCPARAGGPRRLGGGGGGEGGKGGGAVAVPWQRRRAAGSPHLRRAGQPLAVGRVAPPPRGAAGAGSAVVTSGLPAAGPVAAGGESRRETVAALLADCPAGLPRRLRARDCPGRGTAPRAVSLLGWRWMWAPPAFARPEEAVGAHRRENAAEGRGKRPRVQGAPGAGYSFTRNARPGRQTRYTDQPGVGSPLWALWLDGLLRKLNLPLSLQALPPVPLPSVTCTCGEVALAAFGLCL